MEINLFERKNTKHKKRNSVKDILTYKCLLPLDSPEHEHFENTIIPPKTNLEKVVETLNEISNKLKEIGEKELYDKSIWVTNEILSQNIYNYVGLDDKQKLFLKNYSPDFALYSTKELAREEENQESISKKKEKLKTTTFISTVKKYDIELNQIGPDFDVFTVAEQVGRTNMMKSICFTVFNYKEIFNLLKSTAFDPFVEELRSGYTMHETAYYHNDFHACDVLQGSAHICILGELENLLDLNDLDTLSFFFSSVIHDFKHPGFNNSYLVNIQDETFYQFNEKSVLENYHLAETFKLLRRPELNIFSKMENKDFRLIRKRTIEMVLATDMANHSKLLGIMTSRLAILSDDSSIKFNIAEYLAKNKDAKKFDIQQDFLNFILHAVDIGHAAKPFHLEVKWAEMVTAEFFNQGDNEKLRGMPVSFLCDRENADLSKSQVGFINGIVLPTFQLIGSLLPKVGVYVDLIKKSLIEWKNLSEGDKKIFMFQDNSLKTLKEDSSEKFWETCKLDKRVHFKSNADETLTSKVNPNNDGPPEWNSDCDQ